MPGLSALQRFNEEMLTLGDEVKIRSARGEKPVTVPIPQKVEDVDDSDDFKFGMPVLSEEEQAQADAAAAERERTANDFSDLMGDEDDENAEELPPMQEAAPDLSNLLDAEDLSFSDLDLSDFEEDEVEEEKAPPEPKEIPIEDMDLDALLAPKPKPEPVEAPKLQPKPSAKPQAKPVAKPTAKPAAKPQVKNAAPSQAKKQSPQVSSAEKNDFGNLNMSDFEGLDASLFASVLPENSKETSETEIPEPKENAPLQQPDFSDSATSASSATSTETQKVAEKTADETDLFDSLNADFENDSSSKPIDLNANIPLEFNEVPDTPDFGDNFESATKTSSPEENASKSENAGEVADAENFEAPTFAENPQNAENAADSEDFSSSALDDLPDFGSDSFSFDSENLDEQNKTQSSSEDFSLPEDGGSQEELSALTKDFTSLTDNPESDNADSENSESASEESENPQTENTEIDFGDTSGLDDDFFDAGDASSPAENAENAETANSPLDSENLTDDFFSTPQGQIPSPDEEVVEDSGVEGTEESFDTSDIDGLDFSGGESSFDSEGSFDADGGEGDEFFTIPGFSDTQTADLSQKKPDVQAPDFSGAASSDNVKTKNTFTDSEYERLKKNLDSYPLNVKIALEDLIVKNELTDEALFDILEKVLRKVPARTLASELEKLTDQKFDVPKDFERRSAEEYEAYKKSIEYQLKNKIIPGALLMTGAAVLIFCIFVLINTFIIRPTIAGRLYRQGYELIQEEMYPQSEDRFNKALTYKPEKKWFYKYASSYRSHRQFNRSRMMYKAILQRYNHEKKAALDWANMESSDLFNYEEAERILKRETLDYHINDSDALLQLGDLYLDWADDGNPEKYSLAKEQYDLLVELYGSNDLYLSREMRYFIRTDNLRQVLEYKNIFFPRKKSLGASDLTELSGFLLDKRYGKLRLSDEELRIHIENLRELLERAINADSKNPVAQYNMGRYFVETSSPKAAVYYLKEALNLFENQTSRKKRDTYKFINSYRLLGEQYVEQEEYLLAEESYGKGIDLFENERNSSGFESTEQIGKLYSDLADLDYFLAFDNDNALLNYVNAVNNKYDTASVRYKIGYIQYQKENYPAALGSFIKSCDTNPSDMNLLLSLANTLSLNNDSYVARGYYERLLENLDAEREKNRILYNSRMSDSQIEIVSTYMKAANNLGVTLSRLAAQTGNSAMNAKAIVYLQESLRAWDALTRNPVSMERLEGSNLAEQNIKYITNPNLGYEPEIYTEISRTLYGEKEFN